MKSVRTRIMLVTCILVVVSLLVVSAVSVALNLQTTRGTLEQTMRETAKIASSQVSGNLRTYKIIAESVAGDERIYNMDAPIEAKQAAIDELVAHYHDLVRGNILDANGASIFDGTDFSDRSYYKTAIKGTTCVSDPLVSKITGAITIIIATPIWQDGVYGSSIVGVFYMVPTETFLNDIVADIKVSDGAGAQIINKSGTVIAHPDIEFVANESNSQENEKTDPSLKSLAALEREMMAGDIGFGTYSINGVEKFLAYAPIKDSDGWSIGVNAPINDFMHYANLSIIITLVLMVVAIVVSVIFSTALANGIGKPLSFLAGILSSIANTGRVDIGEAAKRQQQDYSVRKDEIGTVAHAASGLIDMLESNVDILTAVADGDLTRDILCRSGEDAIGNALTRMSENLNNMFTDIHVASSQVSAGASQIADGSQALAQGSVQQAASIEQLSASVNEVSQKTSQNAQMSREAAALSDTIRQNAQKGSSQMEQMMNAVKDINEASNSISKVIKAIDDIAFQTNILALNAAVEAARAGQHGKGFAVVAEEVRNLAAKSADAAKDTGKLISDSIEKSQLGYQIATETSASLQEIVDGINRSAEIVSQITESSEEQTTSISQVNTGIQQVAEVIHQNSATSEQSAAASEEMSGQAESLQHLLARFKLKNTEIPLPSGGIVTSAPAHTPSPQETGFAVGSEKY